ncbi:MAG: nuclease-related domain-containing protein [Paenisporosarcina sp.]
MAQLVKLQDYISRYQRDLKRYPTQFVRLKKIQWERMKTEWETGAEVPHWEHEEDEETVEKKGWFKRIFDKKKHQELEWEEEQLELDKHEDEEEEEQEEDSSFHFEPNIVYTPQNLEDLKRMYMDQLFHFQLKWASSTLLEKSHVDPKFLRDSLLRQFTQKLPDNYLLFYYPILQLKKAPLELDILLLTPTEAICIKVLEEENMAAFIGSGDRFWDKKVGTTEQKILNPTIGLNRMETILTQIFKREEIEMPIRKLIVSRNGYIDFPGSTYGFQFIDKRKYPEWFTQLKNTNSPMKHMQLKAAQAVLAMVQTTSYHRVGWEVEVEEEQS